MNLIKETDPYLKHIDAYKRGHGISDREALAALAKIWEQFRAIPENSKVIYGKEKVNVPPVDLGCSHCVKDMLQFIVNWRERLKHEVLYVDFKGVPLAKLGVELLEEKEVTDSSTEDMIKFYKTHLNQKGIYFHHKLGYENLKKLYDANFTSHDV